MIFKMDGNCSSKQQYTSRFITEERYVLYEGGTEFLRNRAKQKSIPLQAVTGPECSRRARLPDFKTIGT
jgi:hypothetical protein